MYTLHIMWPGLYYYSAMDNVSTILLSLVSHWAVMRSPECLNIIIIISKYLYSATFTNKCALMLAVSTHGIIIDVPCLRLSSTLPGALI